MSTKWSDPDFLDKLKAETDAQADEVVREILEKHQAKWTSYVFALASSEKKELLTEAPAPLKKFFDETRDLPKGVDTQRLQRGAEVHRKYGLPSALVELCKSLPEGYSAPSFGHILFLSGDLAERPFHRLIGVLQMQVDVCSINGFGNEGLKRLGDGRAIVVAQKLRLLHAALRVEIIPKYLKKSSPSGIGLDEFTKKYGPPINIENMLAVIMGFSYRVIAGLRLLDVGLKDDEAEDLYYLWRVYGQKMGLHPKGEPDSTEYLPMNLEEAAEFYQSYSDRYYEDASENPLGAKLTRINIDMMKGLMPRFMRFVGFGFLPQLVSYDLLGKEAAARVRLRPISFIPNDFLGVLVGRFITGFLKRITPMWRRALEREGDNWWADMSTVIFRGLIDHTHGGEVRFSLPTNLADLRRLDEPLEGGST